MEIKLEQDGEFGILKIYGSIDKLGTRHLKQYIDDALRLSCKYMLFDISEAINFSTSGLGLIFAARNRLEDLNVYSALIGHEKRIAKLCKGMRIASIFPVAETIGKGKIAVKKFAFDNELKKNR